MTELSRFTFEVLRQDEESVLYRGRSTDGSARVLLRLPTSQYPALQNLKGLQRAYTLKDELDPAWAVRPIEFANHWDRTVLVMEDPGGVPLDQLLGQPLDLALSLRIAIGLSSAIGHLHRRGIIHKDIKPAHVLVSPNTGQCWIMGFGISSRLPRERQSPEPPEFIDGTLPYMAPEQTGRMNRSVDSRSDLYSFGVLLYEMLTGSLPFTATDPMEWVHCHIARQPVPPRQRGVPAAVSAIVMRLLAKTAEERYQTAIGVEYDLRRCLDAVGTSSRSSLPDSIPEFPLGTHDISDQLRIPEKLYGREYEIETLLASFDRVVASGTPELVLVSGYSGIGKSSVVNELHKVLVPPRGLFASGKFDQYKRDIPYATLAQAFQSLIRPLLGKSEAELRYWRDALREALGPNGLLMVDLVPELKLVIGEQVPVPELPSQDAQRRFQLVFRRFIGVFARREHPLALFLDDLQWLDAATLDLLEDLLTRPDVQHLMLIGAYRDNEVNSSHPLMRKLEGIRRSGAAVKEIVLAPLTREALEQLIADALHSETERITPLAQLVHEKTSGNPFFVIQFLSGLAEEALLAFDYCDGRWHWDLSRIRAKGYTDNVVDLMVGKLNRLPVETQKALQDLACLGNTAETTTLSMIRGTSEEQVHSDLWEALRLELITHSEGSYEFTHDRIQEAAYSLLPEHSRAHLHLHISRSLLAKMTSNEVEDDLFEIANQFNLGSTLIFDRDEKDLVAELNLRAGRKAKASAAYNSACTYLSAGMALAGENVWERRYELAFDLWIERAESELLNGNFDEAERLIGYSLERANSKIGKVAAYRVKILLHLMRGYRTINARMETLSESLEAVDSGLECLLLFGIEMPARPTREHVRLECEEIWQELGSRSIESLIDLPVMTDSEARAAMDVLSVLVAPAFRTNVDLMFLFFCRMVKITLTHGISAASTHGIADFATILGPIFHRYDDGYRFGKLACGLIERYKFNAFKTKVYFCVQRTMLWTQSIQTAIDYIRLAIESVVETHDLVFASFSWNHLVEVLLLQGARLDEVWRESQNGIDFIRKIKFRDEDGILHWHQRFILTLLGEAGANAGLAVDQFSDQSFEAGLETTRKACETGSRQYHLAFIVFLYWTLKMQVQYLFGDYHAAYCAAQKAKALVWSAEQHIQSVNYFYYTALTATALYETVDVQERVEMLAMVQESLSWLREWAESNPGTFLDKYSLLMAEVARIEGRHLDAIHLYEQAVRTARENGFVQNEAIANELAAKFYFSLHNETSAYAYLRNASYCYLRWGAIGKVRQLEQQYPRLKEPDKTIGPTSTIDAALDLGILIKVSQAASSEIVLEKLIDTLMRTAIEHAGAERGVLILRRGEQQQIQAEATTNQGGVVVSLQESSISEESIPESILLYAMRTREDVVLSDASAQHPFSADLYIRRQHTRSVLCLPLINQGQVTGLLYLENNLAPNVFTSSRVAVLKMLASQAAISLENTRLYRDLQEREARIRRLVDSNIIGIVIWNFQGNIIDANEAFLRMLEYDREDLLSGRISWLEITPAEQRHLDQRAIEQLKATGIAQPFQKEYFRKDGARVPVLLGAAIFEAGENEGVAFVVDLTEQKRSEEALLRSKTYLAQAQRMSQTGNFWWKVSSGELVWSEELYRILGYDRTAIPSSELVFQRVHPEDACIVKDMVGRLTREGFNADFEYRLLMPNGSIKHLHIMLETMNGESDDRELIGTVMDITARKHAEDALQKIQAELAHITRVTTLGELTTSIAHEINQPLGAIANNAQAGLRFLTTGSENLQDVKEALSDILSGADRVSSIIVRMRALAKRAPPEMAELNFTDVVADMLSLIQHELSRRQVEIELERSREVPTVLGDRVQLQQVLLNLVMNSVEAMNEVPEGSRKIWIRAEPSEHNRRPAILVSVQDSGSGLNQAEVDRLFEAFYTTKSHGLGMGLAISRSIIEAHGGRLWLVSARGPGATFQFVLPATG